MAAPLVIPGDRLFLALEGELFLQQTINTFHYEVTGITGTPTIQDFIEGMIVIMQADFLACCSEEYNLRRWHARRIVASPTRTYTVEVGAEGGTVAADSLPPSVSTVLKRFTNLPGPTGRGRVFMPGVPTTFHDNGILTALGLAAYQAFLPHMSLPVNIPATMTLQPMLFRRPTTFRALEGAAVNTILRSQRRREIGVGA